MANAAVLDRGTIIAEGLQIGGNPGLTTRARVFLNLFLDMLYRAQGWDFLEKEDATLSTAVGVETVSLAGIADFRHVIKLWQAGGGQPLMMEPWSRLWHLVNRDREKNTNGRPTAFALNRNGDELIMWPRPNAIRSLRLLYLSIPDQPLTTPAATYDALTPLLSQNRVGGSWMLVNAVAEYARRWDTDSMLQIARSLVKETTEDLLMSEMNEGAANALTLQLDPNIHGIFRQEEAGFPFVRKP